MNTYLSWKNFFVFSTLGAIFFVSVAALRPLYLNFIGKSWLSLYILIFFFLSLFLLKITQFKKANILFYILTASGIVLGILFLINTNSIHPFVDFMTYIGLPIIVWTFPVAFSYFSQEQYRKALREDIENGDITVTTVALAVVISIAYFKLNDPALFDSRKLIHTYDELHHEEKIHSEGNF